MGKTLFAVMISFGLSGLAHAQDAPAPCGPAVQLPAELSNNVAANSRCFELRMYTAEPERDGKGGINDLHQRFREKEIEIFENHGAKAIAVWQNLDDPNTLVWMLAYRDRAHQGRGLVCVSHRSRMDRAQAKIPSTDRGQRFHDECN